MFEQFDYHRIERFDRILCNGKSINFLLCVHVCLVYFMNDVENEMSGIVISCFYSKLSFPLTTFE